MGRYKVEVKAFGSGTIFSVVCGSSALALVIQAAENVLREYIDINGVPFESLSYTVDRVG